MEHANLSEKIKIRKTRFQIITSSDK